MNVGEHDRHPAAVLLRSAVFLHPDSSEAPDSLTPGGFAAHDTIEKRGILLREMNLSLSVSEMKSFSRWYETNSDSIAGVETQRAAPRVPMCVAISLKALLELEMTSLAPRLSRISVNSSRQQRTTMAAFLL